MPSGDSSPCTASTSLWPGFIPSHGDESPDGINAVPTSILVSFFVTTQPPANFIRVTQNALHDIALETIDFVFVAKLTRTVTDNFARLEVAVEMQESHALLFLARQQCFDDLPQLTPLVAVLNRRLVCIELPIVGKRLFFWARVCP